MNEPKRWAEAASEVDPVVRSLLRHAQSRIPSELEVARLVARIEERSSPVLLRATRRRRAVRVTAWLAVAAMSSVVGAFVGPRLGIRAIGSSGVEPGPSAHPVPRGAATPPSVREPSAAPAPQTSAPTPSAAPEPRAPVVAPRADDRRTSPAPPRSADVNADIESLTEARRVLAGDPARALALTEASTRENPASPFAEERAALAVEALLRLGRESEARRRMQRFEQAFPASPYRRRLNAWLGAQKPELDSR